MLWEQRALARVVAPEKVRERVVVRYVICNVGVPDATWPPPGPPTVFDALTESRREWRERMDARRTARRRVRELAERADLPELRSLTH